MRSGGGMPLLANGASVAREYARVRVVRARVQCSCVTPFVGCAPAQTARHAMNLVHRAQQRSRHENMDTPLGTFAVWRQALVQGRKEGRARRARLLHRRMSTRSCSDKSGSRSTRACWCRVRPGLSRGISCDDAGGKHKLARSSAMQRSHRELLAGISGPAVAQRDVAAAALVQLRARGRGADVGGRSLWRPRVPEAESL